MRVIGVVVLALSACSTTTTATSSTTTSTSSTVPGSQTVITTPGQTYTDEWVPAEQPSPEALTALRAALVEFDASTLLPSDTVSELEDAAATFRVTRSLPTNVVTVTLAIFGDNNLSLGSRRIADSPNDCDDRLTGGSWESVNVRGVTGCAFTNDGGLLFLEWEEGGNRFGIETRLNLDTATSWLNTWYRVP